MKNLVVCNKCMHQFEIKSKSIKKSEVVIDGEQLGVTWFICPKCKQVYVISIIDKHVQQLQSQYQKKRRKYEKSLDKECLAVQTKLHEAMMDKLEKLKLYEAVIRNRYGEKTRQDIYLRYVANKLF